MSADEIAEILTKHEALREDLARSGELLNGAGLVLPEDTIVLRLAPDGVIATRGPLSAADEHMTGYYVVDCDGPERARAIAERTLDRHVLAVELREIHDSSGF
jgi:hypothetical protein